MFSIGDKITDAAVGVCRIIDIKTHMDSVTYLSLERINSDKDRGVLLSTGDCPNLRKIMTKQEAMDTVDRIPYIRTIPSPSDKVRLELFEMALLSNDPIEWIQIIKTHYLRQNDAALRNRPSAEENSYAGKARFLLHSELAVVLNMPYENIENFIKDYVTNSI